MQVPEALPQPRHAPIHPALPEPQRLLQATKRKLAEALLGTDVSPLKDLRREDLEFLLR